MNHSHLSPEVEFRYLITWFREFSEYEKRDFMDIIIQWLLKPNEIHMNGMTESCSQKPTIFYCRVSFYFSFFPPSKPASSDIILRFHFHTDEIIQRMVFKMARPTQIQTNRQAQ